MRVLLASLGPLAFLAERLAEEGGFETAVLQPAHVDLGDFGGRRSADLGGSPVPHFAVPFGPRRPYYYGLFGPQVVRVLRSFHPDVLYLHGEPSELAMAQLAALSRCLLPQTRLVGYSFENVARHWTRFPAVLRGLAERRTLARLDAVAAASGTAAARLRHLLPATTPVEVIYWLTLPSATVERRPPATEGPFRLGYLGRLTPEKGVADLLRALALLPPRVTLTVAGRGAHETALRGLASDLGLAGRVAFAGRLEPPANREFVAQCDAVVLPSRPLPVWQEQFGMVLAEAMSAGTPVIGSSSGAIPEVIGPAGLVFAVGDAGQLAQRIRRLADNPALWWRLSQAARARAGRLFAPAVVTARLGHLFRSLAS